MHQMQVLSENKPRIELRPVPMHFQSAERKIQQKRINELAEKKKSLPSKAGYTSTEYQSLRPDQTLTKHILSQPTARAMANQDRQPAVFSSEHFIPYAAHVLCQVRHTGAPSHSSEPRYPTLTVTSQAYGVAGIAAPLQICHPFCPNESAAEAAVEEEYRVAGCRGRGRGKSC